MMKQEEFAATVDWLGQMIETAFYATLIMVLLVIGSYACSRAAALAWFRTKREYVRSILRESSKRD